jgi:DNA gyrase/topoisomerase IV subunit A
MKLGNDDELAGLLRVDPASPLPVKSQAQEEAMDAPDSAASMAGADADGTLPAAAPLTGADADGAEVDPAKDAPSPDSAPAEVSTPWEKMLLLSEYGFGKRVEFSEFSPHGRGTGGQKIYTVTERTGEIVGCVSVLDNEEIMCITSQGKSIKLKVDTIRVMGRSAQGVKILSIDKPDFVIGVDRIVQEDRVYEKKDAGETAAPYGAEIVDDEALSEAADEGPELADEAGLSDEEE